MSNNGSQKNPVTEILGGLWGLFVLACIAAFLGFIDVPKPIQNLWSRLTGNDPQIFETLKPDMPANQLALIATVQKYHQLYQDSSNDIAKATYRTQRKQEICAQNNGYTDGEWYGVIEKVTTNSDGHGVVSLKIAPNIIIKTWNNALSDIGHGTLIKKDTPLYSGASTLKPGDKVKFTGKFFGDDEQDCLSESSLTIDGAMNEPEFIVQFGYIEAI